MEVAGIYSFNGGVEYLKEHYNDLALEVSAVIGNVKAEKHLTKKSAEKTKKNKMLYSPSSLNKAFKREFGKFGWESLKVYCEYSDEYYVDDYDAPSYSDMRPYREMDFVKERVGVEVQLGKYASTVCNVSAKMIIFHNLDHIDVGIEIVPIKELAQNMSTGVSYFEPFVWDLEHKGVADIDIPVLVLGITK